MKGLNVLKVQNVGDDKEVNVVIIVVMRKDLVLFVYDQTRPGVECELIRYLFLILILIFQHRSWEIEPVVEYTFLIDDKGINFVALYGQTRPGFL